MENMKREKNGDSDNMSLVKEKHKDQQVTNKNCIKNNIIPFTKKWRVKLYLLNENGQWDDKGIGYVFLANEIQEESNFDGGFENSTAAKMDKKLIMLKETTNETIFNIDILKENIEFHNQRGTILTWKKMGSLDEDNIAISFQEKEGIAEIFKNIKIINGIILEDEDFFEEETPFEVFREVTTENLPNIYREIPPDMDESKIQDLVNYLEGTNCEFIKKLGLLLNSEEKKIEEVKSSLSLNSLETDVSLINNKDNYKESINEITEKIINMGEGERGNSESSNKAAFFNENINYIFNIVKNMILYGNKALLELLFDDDNYLISFGALEYDNQSYKIIPHRKYFTEIVKFKNPLNLKDPILIQRIKQNLRLTYLRDTALGRVINENTNKSINLIIQMNYSEIIQFFINNTDFLKVLFSQMESEEISVKKDAILLLTELMSFSKNVASSRVTFNEVLCENGILPILSKLIEQNSKNNENDSISELININVVEIFISILSSVPVLIRQYLVDNEGKTLSQLTNLLLFHDSFPIKYEISQIFKTLIEGEGEASDKKKFFSSTIDKFISYLNSPCSKTQNQNEISTTIQIIIEIFLTWFNNMDFDSRFWLDKHKINLIIIQLLKDKSRTVTLYAIKLLKIILEICENYIALHIITNDLCNILINLFNENSKKNNIIFSCLLNFFDSLSQTNISIIDILMTYSSDFFYENKTYFKNVILRYERKVLPKKKLAGFLMRTYTDASMGQINIFNNFEDYKSNDEDFNYNDSIFRTEDEENEQNDEDLINKSLMVFSGIENNEGKADFLKKKRKYSKSEDDELMDCYGEAEDDDSDKDEIYNNNYKNFSSKESNKKTKDNIMNLKEDEYNYLQEEFIE